MGLIVKDSQGVSVKLSDQPIAQGGEAKIYDIPNYPKVVVKLYHPHVLNKRNAGLIDKINYMTSEGFSKLKSKENLAWPRFAVFDDNGKWCGYAMRKAQGVRMNILAHAKAYREYFPNADRLMLLDYLVDLVGTINVLHKKGVMLGDYNPANFLCDPNNNQVALIDCDSWQVIDIASQQKYFCPVAVPDMLAPELHGLELNDVPRTLESEYFSLAILIFKVLMLGRHPFDVVGGNSPVENIKNGYFPYGTGGGGIPKGAWYNIWSHLSYNMKNKFIVTFKEGIQQPEKRISTDQWLEELKRYRFEMEKSWHNKEIIPEQPKSKEHRGQSVSATMIN